MKIREDNSSVWRTWITGRYSLFETFWVTYVLPSITISLVIAFVSGDTITIRSALVSLAGLFCWGACWLATWRCAKRTGTEIRSIWPNAVKVILIIDVVAYGFRIWKILIM